MMRTIFRLVLKDGLVLTQGERWPGPDGKSPYLSPEGKAVLPDNAVIWLIAYSPRIIEKRSVDGGEASFEIQPAQYKVAMGVLSIDPQTQRPTGISGLKNSAGDEETQVYEVDASHVRFVCRVQGFKETMEEFENLLAEDNDIDVEDQRKFVSEPTPANGQPSANPG